LLIASLLTTIVESTYLLYSLQFSATSINLAQNGQFFYEYQAHMVNLPICAKALRQLLGNQIDRGTTIDIHVSHTT